MNKDLSHALKCVCQGYSESSLGNASIYFKHFGLMDHVDVEEEYNTSLEYAKRRGLPTEPEKIAFCIEHKTWTQKKESDIDSLKSNLKYTEEAYQKAIIGNQKKETEKRIVKIREKLNELMIGRDEAIGLTAESFAQKRSNEYYIYYSCFSDKELKKPFFEKSEFDDLSEGLLDIVVKLSMIERFKVDSSILKKVVIDSFFMNLYRLVEDPVQLFQKPILSLTYTQVEFLTYAKMFKTILSEPEIPDSIREDPDKLIDWYNGKHSTMKEVEKMQQKKGDKGLVALPGATKEQLESVGLGDGLDLKKAIRKNNGMTAKELMKIL